MNITPGKIILGTAPATTHWLDLYGMIMERLSEHLSDPAAFYKKLGIDPNNQGSAAQKIGKLDLEAYRDLKSSWKRVRQTIQLFGLELGEDLTLSPMLTEMQTKTWRQKPWLEVGRSTDTDAVRFEGRDALTALSFFNFYIQQCETLDPAAHMRNLLASQGVTKDNWAEHAGGLGIANPFAGT